MKNCRKFLISYLFFMREKRRKTLIDRIKYSEKEPAKIYDLVEDYKNHILRLMNEIQD